MGEDVEITMTPEELFDTYYRPYCMEDDSEIMDMLRDISHGRPLSLKNPETNDRELWQKHGSCWKRTKIE